MQEVTVQDGLRISLKRNGWHSLVDGKILFYCPVQTPLNHHRLAMEFKDWQLLTPDALSHALDKVDGFFAIILLSEKRIVIAVDKVRSVPLFYCTNENVIRVSDDAKLIRSSNTTGRPHSMAEFDPIGVIEVTAGLYVNGARTLVRNIRQVQAGEWVELSTTASSQSLVTHDYFQLNYHFDGVDNDRWFNDGLTKATDKAVDNLLAIAHDRQIVLPLSGGYDSRFLAIKLVERGAKNLIAFSYGQSEHSREVSFARQVAKTLSIDWVFIPDILEDWEAVWPTESRYEYGVNAGNLCSFPHFQDWLAVKKLEQTGKLHKDAIFCPGHTGDFVSGAIIPQSIISHAGELTYKNRFSDCTNEALDQLAQLIAERWYCHSNINEHRTRIESRIRENLGDISKGTHTVNAEFLIQKYYNWTWRERQAKFIVNSVRVYEDHGYDWWLPFWDSALLEFWCHVPLPQLLGQSAYVKYVKSAYADVVQASFESTNERLKYKSMGNAAGNIWVRNPTLRRVRACVPYNVQQMAARLKRHVQKTKRVLSSDPIIPVADQPYTQVITRPSSVNRESAQFGKNSLLLCPPVDAIGVLAQQYINELI